MRRDLSRRAALARPKLAFVFCKCDMSFARARYLRSSDENREIAPRAGRGVGRATRLRERYQLLPCAEELSRREFAGCKCRFTRRLRGDDEGAYRSARSFPLMAFNDTLNYRRISQCPNKRSRAVAASPCSSSSLSSSLSVRRAIVITRYRCGALLHTMKIIQAFVRHKTIRRSSVSHSLFTPR